MFRRRKGFGISHEISVHLKNAAKRYLQNQVDHILPDSANSNMPAVSVDDDDGGEHLTRGKSDTDHLLKTGKRSD